MSSKVRRVDQSYQTEHTRHRRWSELFKMANFSNPMLRYCGVAELRTLRQAVRLEPAQLNARYKAELALLWPHLAFKLSSFLAGGNWYRAYLAYTRTTPCRLPWLDRPCDPAPSAALPMQEVSMLLSKEAAPFANCLVSGLKTGQISVWNLDSSLCTLTPERPDLTGVTQLTAARFAQVSLKANVPPFSCGPNKVPPTCFELLDGQRVAFGLPDGGIFSFPIPATHLGAVTDTDPDPHYMTMPKHEPILALESLGNGSLLAATGTQAAHLKIVHGSPSTPSKTESLTELSSPPLPNPTIWLSWDGPILRAAGSAIVLPMLPQRGAAPTAAATI